MAWNQKYEALTRDRHNILWTSKISKQNYYGSVIQLVGGGEPLVFEHVTESDDLVDPIKSMRARLTVRSYSMFFFADLYSVDDMTHQVEIYQGANLYFSGFVDPRQYSEPYGPVPYETTIYCVDGLTYLKNIIYEASAGTPYNGLRFKSQIILDILGKIGFTSFREFVNVYEINMNADIDDSPFDQSKLNADRFEGKYCDEVLKEILKEYFAAIKQQDGIFHIWRPRDQRKLTVYGRTFTGATTKTATSMEPQQFIDRPGYSSALRQIPGGNVTIQRPAKKIIIKQDYGAKDSWLDNWDFQPETFDGSTFRNWTKDSGITVLPINSKIASEENGFFIDVAASTGGARIMQAFGYNSVVPGSGADQFFVEFKYMIYNPTVSTISSVLVAFKIYSSSSVKYLQPQGDVNAIFTLSGGTIYITETSVAPGATEWKTYRRQVPAGIPDTGPFWCEFSKGTATESIYIGFKDVKIGVTSGAMAVLTKTTALINTGAHRRTSPSTMMLAPRVATFVIKEITERIYEKTNDINGEEKQYEFEAGDAINSNIDNIIEQFAGAIVVYSGGSNIPSTQWRTRGGYENKPLLEIVGDEIAEHYARPKQLIDMFIMETEKEETKLNMIGSFQDDINRRIYLSKFTTWLNGNFATFTFTGMNITSAISTAGFAYATMNAITVREGDVVSGYLTLTLNSGLAPTILLWGNLAVQSEVITLEEGVNEIELVSEYTGSVILLLQVANNSNFSLTGVYLQQYAKRCLVANRGTFYVKKRIWKLDLHETEAPEETPIAGEDTTMDSTTTTMDSTTITMDQT